MALHEKFSEYTNKELVDIKMDICQKHKCPYLGSIHDSSIKGSRYAVANKCCNYLLYTGHRRECMPDECTYYNDDPKMVTKLKNLR